MAAFDDGNILPFSGPVQYHGDFHFDYKCSSELLQRAQWAFSAGPAGRLASRGLNNPSHSHSFAAPTNGKIKLDSFREFMIKSRHSGIIY